MSKATTYATTLRAFNHDGDEYLAGSTQRVDSGLFGEWSAPGVGLMRKATATEIAKASGTRPAPKPKSKRSRKNAAPAKATTPPAEPAVVTPDPASDEA